MSSRAEYRRRDRSWERDDRDREHRDRDRDRYSRHGRDRGRDRSRSKSPPRRGDRERDRRSGASSSRCTFLLWRRIDESNSNVLHICFQTVMMIDVTEMTLRTGETTDGGTMTVTGIEPATIDVIIHEGILKRTHEITTGGTIVMQTGTETEQRPEMKGTLALVHQFLRLVMVHPGYLTVHSSFRRVSTKTNNYLR